MSLQLTVVTPEGEAYRDQVTRVVLPGSEGDFGVLEGHERFLAPLRIGELEIQSPGDTLYAAISGGFADVSAEEVVVLAETCELAHDIDMARAERAHARARARLEEDAEAHRAAFQRATVRIQVARRLL